MSTITLEKPETLDARIDVQFKEAKTIWGGILTIEKWMSLKRDELEILAFHLGAVLTEMKDEVGHGKWLLWLVGKWPALSERNAQRCMAFFRDNPAAVAKFTMGGIKSVESTDFTDEAKRKFRWHYVPAKERMQLAGDEDVRPQPHYLTFVNQYSKWRRQVKIGHAELPPIDTMRRDFEPTMRDLIELLGPDWVSGLL